MSVAMFNDNKDNLVILARTGIKNHCYRLYYRFLNILVEKRGPSKKFENHWIRH